MAYNEVELTEFFFSGFLPLLNIIRTSRISLRVDGLEDGPCVLALAQGTKFKHFKHAIKCNLSMCGGTD